MNNKSPMIFGFAFFLITATIQAQEISIDSCYQWAKINYPLVKQLSLIEKSKEYSIENAQKGYLPQVNVAGYSTYQSDILAFPFTVPGSTIEPLRQDQHRIYSEITQPLTDLFNVKNQKELVQVNAQVENQKLEIEFYKLKDRINQLFFGILLIDAQIEQVEILKKDIDAGITKTSVAIENGIALKSSIHVLSVELLKANQRIIELRANRKAFIEMLSLLTNQKLGDSTTFITPIYYQQTSSINRPELRLFDLQAQTFEGQRKLLANKTLPKLNLFFQGGVGAPGLNIIENNPAAYYITGIRLNWNLTSLYTFKREKKIMAINQKGYEIQKDLFLFNTNITLQQQNAEIIKAQELIESDKSIIALRESIKITTMNQLQNGTATAHDYLTVVNAKDQAQQNYLLHQIQFLMAQYNYKTTSGN